MPKVEWNDDAILALARQRSMDGAEELAYIIKTDAMEHCPVALVNGGTLRASHGVERTDMKVEIGCGGAAAPYALKQHERVDFHHSSGEAKWLENAFQRHIPELEKYVEKHLKL